MERNEARSSLYTLVFFLLVLLLWESTPCSAQIEEHPMIGGWKEQNPRNPMFYFLARWVESQAAEPGGSQYQVTSILSVSSQLVNGVNYKIRYTRAPTNCNYGEDTHTGRCRVVHRQRTDDCVALIFISNKYSKKYVTEYSCIPRLSGA